MVGEVHNSYCTQNNECYNKTLHKVTPTHPLLIAVSGSCVALLLLLVGLFYCCEHKCTQDTTEGGTNRGEESVVNSDHATYAVVRKQGADGVVGPEEVTYEEITKEGDPNVSGANTQPYLSEENALYSLLNHGSTRAETPN
ncbi:Hypothetical predicted protein [Scomber scombrus]|uniref:Uncharacterized protein n=1 Tax=Scomber scombrus TaxID=13677 RepID=A0AAV1Q2L0_SCOSC